MEAGSDFPYITYPIAQRLGFRPYCCDIRDSYYPWFQKLDLNKDKIAGKFDLVICTEVLEHLACNLYDALGRLASAVNQGGYMICSVPIGIRGLGISLNDELPKIDIHQHRREFTFYRAQSFFKSINMRILKQKVISNNLTLLMLHYIVVLQRCE
jgi:2-polyprenyl-3-methyl-5-hydroxy-6-metoxy-1,4-benzoquinol methylase